MHLWGPTAFSLATTWTSPLSPLCSLDRIERILDKFLLSWSSDFSSHTYRVTIVSHMLSNARKYTLSGVTINPQVYPTDRLRRPWERVEVHPHPFFNLAVRWGCVAEAPPRQFYPRERVTWHTYVRLMDKVYFQHQFAINGGPAKKSLRNYTAIWQTVPWLWPFVRNF